jgi:hypothetical protein
MLVIRISITYLIQIMSEIFVFRFVEKFLYFSIVIGMVEICNFMIHYTLSIGASVQFDSICSLGVVITLDVGIIISYPSIFHF